MASLKPYTTTAPEEYERSRSGHFEDHRVRTLEDHLGLSAASRQVLELGCGTGSIVDRLAARHPAVQFHAVDVDTRLLAYAREHHAAPNVTWWSQLPEARLVGLLDAIYSVDVIHHLDDRPAMFDALRTRLGPGGTWTVVEPNIWHPVITWQQERMKRAGVGEDHFRPWIVEAEFRDAGFVIERRSYWHFWPATLRHPPSWARSVEDRFQGSRFLGGSVVYRLASLRRS